jgi:hypothetical protein
MDRSLGFDLCACKVNHQVQAKASLIELEVNYFLNINTDRATPGYSSRNTTLPPVTRSTNFQHTRRRRYGYKLPGKQKRKTSKCK